MQVCLDFIEKDETLGCLERLPSFSEDARQVQDQGTNRLVSRTQFFEVQADVSPLDPEITALSEVQQVVAFQAQGSVHTAENRSLSIQVKVRHPSFRAKQRCVWVK
jgi:hypothetical protein